MGLMPDQFYAMTWVDYSRAAQGYWLRHSRYLEGVRKLSYYMVVMNADPKKARSVKEHRLFELITDPVRKASPIPQEHKPRLSAEQWANMIDKFNKRLNRK